MRMVERAPFYLVVQLATANSAPGQTFTIYHFNALKCGSVKKYHKQSEKKNLSFCDKFPPAKLRHPVFRHFIDKTRIQTTPQIELHFLSPHRNLIVELIGHHNQFGAGIRIIHHSLVFRRPLLELLFRHNPLCAFLLEIHLFILSFSLSVIIISPFIWFVNPFLKKFFYFLCKFLSRGAGGFP